MNVTSVSSALSFSRFFSETDPATMSEIAPEANAEDSTQSSGLLANTKNGAETETQCVSAFGAMGAGVGAIVGDVSAGPAGAWAGLQGGALVGSMVGGLTCGDVSQPLDTTFPAVGPDPAAMAPIDEPTDPAEGGAIASDAGAATATSKTEPDASVASPDATAPAPTPTGDNPTDSTITNPDETDLSQNASYGVSHDPSVQGNGGTADPDGGGDEGPPLRGPIHLGTMASPALSPVIPAASTFSSFLSSIRG